MIEKSDKELLDALGIEVEKRINPSRSPREEYIISGFEEIQIFFEKFKRLPENIAERDVFTVTNMLSGTWSGSLMTPLSVAGDYVFGFFDYRWGEDYKNLFLSLPPGFLTDSLGYERPLTLAGSVAHEMRFGIGGYHATVLPFRNFSLPGVFFVLAFIGFALTKIEKKQYYLYRR